MNKKNFLSLNLSLLFTINTYALVFIDNAVTNDTYIPSNKKNQIILAHKMALDFVNKRNPTCQIKSKVLIGHDGPLSFYKQAQSESNFQDQFLVGFIHSSEALLAASLLKNSNALALSSGASTDNLFQTNQNFYSIANPISLITEHVLSFINHNNIKKIGIIIPGNSSFSLELASKLKLSLKKTINIEIDINKVNSSISDIDLKKYKDFEFLYVPGFLQQTLPIIKKLNQHNFKGIIYGSANLARSKPDLDLFYRKLGLQDIKLLFPATWENGESQNSIFFENQFKSKFNEEIMGTAIYTYDATVIAAEYICQGNSISKNKFEIFIKNKVLNNKNLTIRKYLKIENGHLISSVKTVEYIHKEKKFKKIFQ